MELNKTRRLICLGIAIFSVVLINLFVLELPHRVDLTTEKIYSLSDQARRVLENIDQPVYIVFAYDVRSRAQKDSVNTLRNLAKNSAFITVDLFDPVLEPALAEANGIRFSGSGFFRSGDREVLFDDPTEIGFINALVRVISNDMGLLCFSDGHLESNPFSLRSHDHSEEAMAGHNHSTGGRPLSLHERHGMGIARESLENLGFSVEQRILLKGSGSLLGCSALVIASPQTSFDPKEINLLKEYIDMSGRVLILLEPDVTNGLKAMLAEYDIAFSKSRIQDFNNHYWADISTPMVTSYPRSRVTRDLPLTFFPGVVELRPADRNVERNLRTEVLLATSPNSTLDGEKEEFRSRIIGVKTKDLDNDSILLVVGDGDFATNSYFEQLGNGSLFIKLVNELSQSANSANIMPRHYVEGKLTLSRTQLNIVFFTNIFLGPILLFLFGLLVWSGRR